MTTHKNKEGRKDKLRSALRDNLKRRKSQTKKIAGDTNASDVSLRNRDFSTIKKDPS